MEAICEYTLKAWRPDDISGMVEMMRQGWEIVWVFYDEGEIVEALWRRIYDAKPREYDVGLWDDQSMPNGWQRKNVLLEDMDEDYPRSAYIKYSDA